MVEETGRIVTKAASPAYRENWDSIFGENKMAESAELEWAWCFEPDDRLYGPFPSKEEAVKAAKEEVEELKILIPDKPAKRVIFGRVNWIQPENYCPNLDDFLEQMENAVEGEACFDESVFSVKGDFAVASEAFKKIAQEFVSKYVTTSGEWIMVDEESPVEI